MSISLSGEILHFFKAGSNGFLMFPLAARNNPKLLALGHLQPNITLKGFLPFLDPKHVTFSFEVVVSKGDRGLLGEIVYAEPLHRGGDSLARILLGMGFQTAQATLLQRKIPSTASLLDYDSNALRSIVPELSQECCAKWDRMVDFYKTHNLVHRYGFSSAHYNRIVEILGSAGSVAERVTSNPYLLLSSPDFDFNDVKRLVVGRNLSPEFLLQGYILQTLRMAFEEGHTCVPEDVLLRSSLEKAKVYSTDLTEVQSALGSLCDLGVVSRVFRNTMRMDSSDTPKVFLASSLSSERAISATLLDKMGQRHRDIPVQQGDFSWGNDQVKALDAFSRHGILALSGLPGTGKTTLIRSMVAMATKEGLSVRLLAPTGMAARRMSSVTGKVASTIHHALGYDGQTFHVTSVNEDLIVVDEMSMVDSDLFARLLSCIPLESRLVLVGDDAQLPSVGAGNVFKDILNSGAIPSVRLTEVFRQAEGNAIIRASHAIHKGQTLGDFVRDPTSNFRVIECTDPELALRSILKVALKFTEEKRPFQVLSPIYRGPLGIDELNRELKRVLNPDSPTLLGEFSQDDTVVFIKNNTTSGYYNGDFGRVTGVTKAGLHIEVISTGKNVILSSTDLFENLRHGYCISVHRSQGNEYGTVFMPLFPFHGRMLERTLLYTAVTRAKDKVVLLAHPEALKKSIMSSNVGKRNTCLQGFLDGTYV